MKYQPPFGSSDPNAPYVDRNTGSATAGSKVPAAAIEDPQRELVALINAAGLTPSEDDLSLVARAIQTGKLNYVIAGGTANALTVTLPVAPLAYYDGMPVRFKAAADSTGAVTINVNGLGAKSVTPTPQFKAGKYYIVYYGAGADAFVFAENAFILKNLTRIVAGASQTLANSTQTTLALASVSDDGQADFTQSGNTLVCARAGRYAISGRFGASANPSTVYALTMGLKKNGTDIMSASVSWNGLNLYQQYGGAADVIDVAAGDVFTLWGYQVSSGSLTLAISSSASFQRQSN